MPAINTNEAVGVGTLRKLTKGRPVGHSQAAEEEMQGVRLHRLKRPDGTEGLVAMARLPGGRPKHRVELLFASEDKETVTNAYNEAKNEWDIFCKGLRKKKKG